MTLPQGWVNADLLEVVTLHDSRRIPLNQAQRAAIPGDYPYYGANGQVDTVGDYLFEGEHILLAEDGGYFDQPERGVAYRADGKFWVNNHAHILSTLGDMPASFVERALNLVDWMQIVSGTTRLKLTQGGMARVSLAIPPLAEQCRIVAKLDALIARLARARAELDRVPVLAARHKEALIHQLIRSQKWETVPFLSACEAYQPKTISKSELAEGGRYPVYGANGEIGHFDRYNHEHPQLLITCRGATCGAINISKPFSWINGNAMVVDGSKGGLSLDFLRYYFAADFDFESVISGTAQPQITRQSLAVLRMPVVDRVHQEQIARTLDAAFARADRLEAEATRARALIDRLEAAILARAFRGKLVPQDPADEPASVLLDRIRAQRAGAPKPKRGRRAAAAA